ncbi:hypothetical protein C2857_001553 [Epichloe festucae Fl1]|uniref:Myb-like domain-containing protein n=1 Tax=Epichloe festucae (strain Fl1) TaxID=877507 RepID=A0A7S9KRK3_EPIFF|nr:hypothetical protein C2857_001553 [Epichloe festucae Fl1]
MRVVCKSTTTPQPRYTAIITMLLPSALSCDATQPSRPAQHLTSYFSPPSSPPTLSSATALSNIMTTCRSLQSLIATPAYSSHLANAASSSARAQLPTPPMAHASLPMKLRLRARAGRSGPSTTDHATDHATDHGLYTRRRISKRPAPPRGSKKRRRDDGDDMGREDLSSEEEDDSDAETRAERHQSQSSQEEQQAPELPACPSTPKRARIAPEQLPLGLERSDFHDVHSIIEEAGSEDSTRGTDVEVEADGDEWSAEDDRVLVELVLEKLRLSKSEWQDCARNLGKDRHSVSRRWKSLMIKGEVGLKTRSSSRRTRLHSTWR